MTSQILLFSQSRSGSTMLERMFEKQDNLKIISHPFSSSRGIQLAWMQSDCFEDGMTADARSKWSAEINKAIDNWRSELAATQRDGKVFMNHTALIYPLAPEMALHFFVSHREGQIDSYTAENPTMMPDDLLLHPGTTPVFTIRHPILTISSAHRTMGKMDVRHGGGRLNFFSVTCQIWYRMMYDFYVNKGITPIVVDGDDIMTSEAFVRQLCSRVGLDPDQAYLSWPAATAEEKEKIHPMYYASQSTLIDSSKPEPARAAKNINLEAERAKWDDDFGQDAPYMRELVEMTMPHYKYLYERRMKMDEA